MADEHSLARYRRWYRELLRFYSRPYRERFAESMEQTFSDLCRERAKAGKGLGRFVLWLFVETSAGIVRDNGTSIMMQTNIVRIAIVAGLILLIPLWGNHYVEGWNWSPLDFVFAGVLLFGTGVTYDLIARRGGTTAYRVAVGISCATGLVLVWINAAVGIIGDGSVNLMYFGVLAVGAIGAIIANLEPRGMSRALVATAVAQALVPLIALTWVPTINFSPGVLPVFGLNAVFVALWLVAALLFRHAGSCWPKSRGEEHTRGASRIGIAE
jgi:hypothetical protein